MDTFASGKFLCLVCPRHKSFQIQLFEATVTLLYCS